MNAPPQVPAILLLADGTYWIGKSAGKIGTTIGEICFNTAVTGYQEVFTDPSYFGQILLSTHVHIGNYGISNLESESHKVQISGLVCKEFNVFQSRPQADYNLQNYFEEQQIVAIANVDTRSIVRHIRSKGAMNGIISSETLAIPTLEALLKQAPNMQGLELASKVSAKSIVYHQPKQANYKVVLIDYGVKSNIIRSLVNRNCEVIQVPHDTNAKAILALKPHGVMLSNGPGDPATMQVHKQTISELLHNDISIFGICLGHQLLAGAVGINTYKMHHGHRGINHPVKNLITGQSEITSQNHGFSIVENEVENHDHVTITHINLNDNTIEGIKIKDKKAFSVQYHPEAAPGTHDSAYLFDQFISTLNH